MIRSFFHILMPSVLQQTTASSYTERFLLGITKSWSIPRMVPKPSHLLQAPYGELKLNNCGDGISKAIPSNSNLLLNTFLVLPGTSITHSPSLSENASETESARRYKLSSVCSAVALSIKINFSFFFSIFYRRRNARWRRGLRCNRRAWRNGVRDFLPR